MQTNNDIDYSDFSIVIPAKDEADSLPKLFEEIQETLPDIAEIILVNDGSADNTSAICKLFSVTEIKHPFPLGNGAAVKSGVRYVKSKFVIMMDADGQHSPTVIPSLVSRFLEGYDLIIGARSYKSQASSWRMAANLIYNKFASYMSNHKIMDLTSGFRVFNVEKFNELAYLYPNGFSYPTTSTMAFLRSGYPVGFVQFEAKNRQENGGSHINIIKDGIKFLLIIFRIGTLYSPLKVFFPVALVPLLLGLLNYAYTYVEQGRFTNMSAVLLVSSALIFLNGLISEQITMLLYRKNK